MNYRTLGYRFLYILFKYSYKFYKFIRKLAKIIFNIIKISLVFSIAFLKRKANFAFWQVALVALLGAVIFYGGSTLFFHDATDVSTPTTNFKIIISKIGLERDVYEDADEGTFAKGPSHFPGTALPTDQTGNVVIFGHSAQTKEHDAPFSRLDELNKGDEIILKYDNKEFRYEITNIKTVESDDMSVIDPTEEPTLTLITCIKPDFPKDKRLIFSAKRL